MKQRKYKNNNNFSWNKILSVLIFFIFFTLIISYYYFIFSQDIEFQDNNDDLLYNNNNNNGNRDENTLSDIQVFKFVEPEYRKKLVTFDIEKSGTYIINEKQTQEGFMVRFFDAFGEKVQGVFFRRTIIQSATENFNLKIGATNIRYNKNRVTFCVIGNNHDINRFISTLISTHPINNRGAKLNYVNERLTAPSYLVTGPIISKDDFPHLDQYTYENFVDVNINEYDIRVRSLESSFLENGDHDILLSLYQYNSNNYKEKPLNKEVFFYI
eukprot:TRINITY_DN1225_c0_g2_i1.p1 TRINITY_DN1225_c0_g2~~TRINITY_DN1225_c0_g2_i1.p1  ORF type:complete len:270 (-),score=46.05 TRINITY_DN1225_c0_g2_i1:134-943(-)